MFILYFTLKYNSALQIVDIIGIISVDIIVSAVSVLVLSRKWLVHNYPGQDKRKSYMEHTVEKT